eukprot:TRINITY_DN11162_c0_g1_i1.p1 TRINITY_DN11162_c0_g1~~TRINITY_DN11162_c0_g1_i1.p1  ORF type:complete len:271 (+),score=39.93 TRINITY_DN11162_c0_g1_i1:36-848(+)
MTEHSKDDARLSDAAVEEAAEVLAQARQNHVRVNGLPETCRPTSALQAAQIQDRLMEKLGETSYGWKCGATSTAGFTGLGMTEPFFARLLLSRKLASGDSFASKRTFHRGVECEYAFEMAQDLPASGAPYTEQQVQDAVGSIYLGIELIDSRFHDWKTHGGYQITADNGADGAFVVGPQIKDWLSIDRVGGSVTLHVDGEKVAEGTGAAVLEDPLKSLTWLANALPRFGHSLKAGEIITTGSCTGIKMVGENAKLVATFGDVGKVEVTIE